MTRIHTGYITPAGPHFEVSTGDAAGNVLADMYCGPDARTAARVLRRCLTSLADPGSRVATLWVWRNGACYTLGRAA